MKKRIIQAKGKDGKPRVLPLNRTAHDVFKILVEDSTTGEWLFTNRDGEPIKAIRKGFSDARVRANIEDLRPYDLRHTFATRLLERGVHHFLISALLGHSTPMTGFGHGSRMTPGYAHATWDALVTAVETLEQDLPLKEAASAGDLPRVEQLRKAG